MITVKNIEDMGLWSSPNREPHWFSSLMVCIRGWQPCSSQSQRWKWPSWCLPTPYQYIVRQTMFQVIKELCIQLTNPSVLIEQRSSAPKWMLQRRGLHVTALHPKPLCGAESVEKAAAFATTWCNELAVAIMQEMNLETGAFMARVLISRRAHDCKRKAFSAAKKGQKSKRRIKKGHRIRNWQQKECSMRQESFEWQFWL